MQTFLRHPHLWAGHVKRLMRYAMHSAAERLTPAPQCTRTPVQSQQVFTSILLMCHCHRGRPYTARPPAKLAKVYCAHAALS